MAKALIVDDSKFMRRIIKDTLLDGGHEIVAEADNGSDGILRFQEFKPDFITMDITMGGKDGMFAVKEIKNIDSSAKIIVVSALNERTIKSNQKDVNPDAFVTKPFEKSELLKTIDQVLKG